MGAPFKKFEAHGLGGPRITEIPLRMVLPNLVTVLAICAGLSGIRFAFENRFETAVVMVLLAAFLDGIDGRLARLLKATSKFGAQMDSLADIVNFGVAPALVLYAYLLDRAGSPGWIAALLFAIACGMRLARFNVLDEQTDRPAWQADYFVGVPAPAGAVLVMLPLYLAFLGMPPTRPIAFAGVAFTVLIAFLLVSRLPVYSGKSVKIPGDRVLPVILAVVLYMLLLVSYPWHTLTASVLAYLVFLPFSVRAYSRRAKKEGEAVLPPDVDHKVVDGEN
ncbi:MULTISPECIES: CDP-diacylglycerol--serine O-phosphatidyltransferase [Phyllobacteriaceae]|jgi:CDP-diacylglycerol--serine O-phosphatidyltransferase|uniref:CDP-diacylglycerol--serine O-phosphatidyltransferase n=2 Tax=Pseudomonadota TaxID=1224 RepID=A0A1C2DIQ7_9HYPH|nr:MULTISPECIES: CDP-diacylglycerol--serine O-phosphatidyltransferase [Mesorhizobium]MBN9234238.1 CDP-diacylglycerol--serine O-phosphatidyltransferase [Mesorhizobium sp.]MDQ0332303.1 CDP-diacylglycerol--serine O-phosphatidyltransferase [Mesorhizobium sp. YL-MeA3-2017]OCX14652.1 CDP-diacylglycerol--serine O-phosphatidyltransferase [Mesorhizobium hungaricum]